MKKLNGYLLQRVIKYFLPVGFKFKMARKKFIRKRVYVFNISEHNKYGGCTEFNLHVTRGDTSFYNPDTISRQLMDKIYDMFFVNKFLYAFKWCIWYNNTYKNSETKVNFWWEAKNCL